MVNDRPKEAAKEDVRESWDNSIEFGLSLLGYAVSLGNIVRFPYLVLRNGGGSFLVPYFTCLLICGVPLYYLEMAMGQSTRKSCISCWDKYAPALKGAGVAMVLMSFISCFLYQAYLAWILHYIAASLVSIVKWELPWQTCNATWNTENCVLTIGNLTTSNATEILTDIYNSSDYINAGYGESSNSTIELLNSTARKMSAAEQYWQHYVLRLSEEIQDVGTPNWRLCVAHVVSWIILYLCLRKSVQSVGKVVWVTATAPYLLITIFFIRAILLPGSMEGIKFYLTPDFEALKNPEVWMLAFLQIFYSLGPGWGGIITMASYNDHKHKFNREAYIIPVVTCFTSFYNGFVIFSCAGFIAHKSGVSVRDALSSGPGLAFITYPEVTTHLPGGPIWALLFFLMMLMVGVDTMFVVTETCASSIKDVIPQRFKSWPLWLMLIFNIPFGPLLFTNGGMYIFQLLDWYFTVLGTFLAAALEGLVIIWIYGYDRLENDIRTMISGAPTRFITIPLFGVIIPVLLALAMIWSISNLSTPIYGTYVFPDWCGAVGWFFGIMVIVPIPVYIVYKYMQLRGRDRQEIMWRMWQPWKLDPTDEIVPMTPKEV